jgi:glycosyltransferase involved in cell wall biosynthesis
VVHAHNFGPLVYGAGAARLAGTRGLVYTLHGPEASEREDLGRIDRIRTIDRVISVSDHVAAVAADRSRIDRSRITTIYNGIDIDSYARALEPSRDLLRKEWGVEDAAAVIGTVARLTPEKDHSTLLEAFALVLKSHPSTWLVLAGDGDRRGPLEERARALGIDARVRFLGTRRDVPAVLGALDLFVLPSVIEGLGITLIEAMAAGLPCVATRTGGIPEVAGDDVVLVESGDVAVLTDAMRWMLDHPEQAVAMARTGRARVSERFGIDEMVAGYERVYAELCDQPRRVPLT